MRKIKTFVAAVLGLLVLMTCGAQADQVFVSSAGAGVTPSWPSQYSLKPVPADTDVVSVCDDASIAIGRADMATCNAARRWVLRTAVKSTDKVGYCYGTAMSVSACDIATGGGEGWQLASAIWTTTPIPPGPPIFTGTATLSCTPPTQNTDGSALTNLTGYHWLYGAANPPAMPLATTTACAYLAENLTVGTWYFAVTAYTPTAESVPSAVVSKTIADTAVCTAPKPADKTQPGTCPAGTTGNWTQTATFAAAAYPTCWIQGPWLPTTAPAGACVTTPVGLKTAEAIGYALYAGNHNKDTFQRVGTFAAPVPCTVAFFSDLGGVVKNIISNRDNLKLDAGATRPKQVWAKCQ